PSMAVYGVTFERLTLWGDRSSYGMQFADGSADNTVKNCLVYAGKSPQTTPHGGKRPKVIRLDQSGEAAARLTFYDRARKSEAELLVFPDLSSRVPGVGWTPVRPPSCYRSQGPLDPELFKARRLLDMLEGQVGALEQRLSALEKARPRKRSA